MNAPHVALLSLEPWDTTWRRNQHLAARLVHDKRVGTIVFVEPPSGGLAPRAKRRSESGVQILQPPLIVPRRHGGHRVMASWLRLALRGAGVLWVNDPVVGAGFVRAGIPIVYDVTDDWRSMAQDTADHDRIVAAEALLARHATATVVCSDELADRWRDRYAVAAAVIPNGVDVASIRAARPLLPEGAAPHAVYVGTLHDNRVDIDLVIATARAWPGTVHLVGPDRLGDGDRARLNEAGVRREGAVPHEMVPAWLTAADVLICPHLIDAFTLSLDAIKAHEYLTTARPIVATPSSGFQARTAPGLDVVSADEFPAAVVAAVGRRFDRPAPTSWDERAAAFAAVLLRARDG